MDFGTITNYFAEYGLLFLFVIILLEYMNLPGLPAGDNNAGSGRFSFKK